MYHPLLQDMRELIDYSHTVAVPTMFIHHTTDWSSPLLIRLLRQVFYPIRVYSTLRKPVACHSSAALECRVPSAVLDSTVPGGSSWQPPAVRRCLRHGKEI